MRKVKMIKALCEAFDEELARDPAVCLFGEDVGSFGGVLSNSQEMDQMRSALQEVTGGLSTAFETTLEGLVAALCIHMLMIMVQRREEQFLDECKDYCQKHIVGRLRLGTAQD